MEMCRDTCSPWLPAQNECSVPVLSGMGSGSGCGEAECALRVEKRKKPMFYCIAWVLLVLRLYEVRCSPTMSPRVSTIMDAKSIAGMIRNHGLKYP